LLAEGRGCWSFRGTNAARQLNSEGASVAGPAGHRVPHAGRTSADAAAGRGREGRGRTAGHLSVSAGRCVTVTQPAGRHPGQPLIGAAVDPGLEPRVDPRHAAKRDSAADEGVASCTADQKARRRNLRVGGRPFRETPCADGLGVIPFVPCRATGTTRSSTSPRGPRPAGRPRHRPGGTGPAPRPRGRGDGAARLPGGLTGRLHARSTPLGLPVAMEEIMQDREARPEGRPTAGSANRRPLTLPSGRGQ
jgi:hypothetical protein